ncbi:MAG: hypothetical protein ACFBSG_08330 [Leptolyngbyaceae cyanobacterium]
MLKRIAQTLNLRQLFAVVLDGYLALTSIACSSQVATPETSNPSVGNQGMYPYEDTERDTSAADAKTEQAVRQAEERRQAVDNPQDYLEEVEPIKKVQQQAKDLGESIQASATDAVESTQADLEELPQKADEAADEVADTIEENT